MTEQQLVFKDRTAQFYGVREVYLPKVCIACGKETKNSIKKTILGHFSFSKRERKDYHIHLPVCEKCSKNSKIDKSIETVKVIVPTSLSLLFLFIIAFLTYSIVMGLGLVIVSFSVTFIHYKTRMRKKVDIDKFVQLRALSLEENRPEELLEFKFLNKEYAEKICDINLDQNKDLQLVDTINLPTITHQMQDDKTLINCSKCGKPQIPNQRFCTECGQPMSNIQPGPTKSTIIPKTSLQISSLKAESTPSSVEAREIESNSINNEKNEINCPHCNQALSWDSKFCTACGKRLYL